MKRQVLGVIVASVAAPYLGAIVMSLSIGLNKPAAPFFEGILTFFIDVTIIGTFAFILYGIIVLGIAVVAALMLYAFEARSLIAAVLPGSILGACFAGIFASPNFEDWPLILGFFISGAICGWIYWRIALKSSGSPITELT